MIRLKVEKKEEHNYLLKDSKNNSYELGFEFFDIEKEPKENDYISISAELLNPRYQWYTTYFYFGGLKNISGRKDVKPNDIDVIELEIEGKGGIFLKRLYG